MRYLIRTALLILVFAVGSFSQDQGRPEIAPANRNLVPRDFTLDGEPLSLKFTLPFKLLVNGREHPVAGPVESGSTMWLAVRGRGGFTLSLEPCYGYSFKKSGAILDHAIVFQADGDKYELRFSGPIAGRGNAWNLYVLHEPSIEAKPPALFETFDWSTCYPSLRPLLPDGPNTNRH